MITSFSSVSFWQGVRNQISLIEIQIQSNDSIEKTGYFNDLSL